jgi:hypothetical protein
LFPLYVFSYLKIYQKTHYFIKKTGIKGKDHKETYGFLKREEAKKASNKKKKRRG